MISTEHMFVRSARLTLCCESAPRPHVPNVALESIPTYVDHTPHSSTDRVVLVEFGQYPWKAFNSYSRECDARCGVVWTCLTRVLES